MASSAFVDYQSREICVGERFSYPEARTVNRFIPILIFDRCCSLDNHATFMYIVDMPSKHFSDSWRKVRTIMFSSHVSPPSPCRRSCRDLSTSTCQWPIPPDLPGLHVPSDSVLPSQHGSPSIPLSLHFHFRYVLLYYVSSLLFTCPNHSNLLVTIAIGYTIPSSKISPFLRCSSWLTPIAEPSAPSSSLLLSS